MEHGVDIVSHDFRLISQVAEELWEVARRGPDDQEFDDHGQADPHGLADRHEGEVLRLEPCSRGAEGRVPGADVETKGESYCSLL